MRRFRSPLLAIPPSKVRSALVALAVGLLGGCSGSGDPSSETTPAPASTATVHAAYVLLTQVPDGTTQPLARVIVEGTAPCPRLDPGGGGSPVPTAERHNPHGFSVRVCEALVPFGQAYTVEGSEKMLPAASYDPTHPVILGDSGCKARDCPSGPAQPFARIAALAASENPDLVLHAGDLNYRGTAGYDDPDGDPMYDAGDIIEGDPSLCQLESPYVSQNAAYSDDRDTWDNWNLDFFEPAAPLLAQAPWVVTRGNHELCSRAGPGWFYFLDPSSNLKGDTQILCPDQGGQTPPDSAYDHIILRAPQTIELGTLRVVSIDAANACDDYAPDFTTDQYTSQFEGVLRDIAALPAGSPTTWILGHRPTWAASSAASGAISQTLSTAFARALTNRGMTAPPAGLTLVVSGHMHQFQSATVAGGRPPQLVVGNSGVATSGPDPAHTFDQEVDGLTARGIASTAFGFLDVTSFDAATGSWQGTLKAEDGSTIATCDAPSTSGSICTFPSPAPDALTGSD